MKTPEKIERPPLFRTAAVLEWLEELTAAVVFIAVVFTFLVRVVTVSGTSMVPNYQDQDRLLVAGCWGGPRQGDVVVLLGVLKEPIIKRVIATAGQTVSFDEEAGVVLVDGQPVDDTQFGLENGCTYLPFGSPDRMEFPQTVPPGCIFVLGDNRMVSEDSRFRAVGMVDERHILGRAVFRLYPAESLGPVV
ncbi:signal peptidase I [Oscillospiraceae bacterium 42-9]|jgi:signal peptidase I|uniref:signal peptidase I n=1 Tax=Acutalibacter sp. TaxID=1918636 RepID=UPI00216EB763|nr:signal peptidase I [Acutalibacter sp.]